MTKHILRAAKIVGTQAALAQELSITPAAVTNWLFRNTKVPAEYCPTIERVTGGRVRCEQLRPDVEWKVLRQSGKWAD